MNEDIVKKAILTLEVLIDECKEDGTSYTARKEWEALKVFKQLQNNWNELKKSIENDIKEYEESEFHIKEPPISIQTKINILIQMQELEKKQ